MYVKSQNQIQTWPAWYGKWEVFLLSSCGSKSYDVPNVRSCLSKDEKASGAVRCSAHYVS